jgi:hypothetical protein
MNSDGRGGKILFVNKTQTALQTKKDHVSNSVVIGSSTYPVNGM